MASIFPYTVEDEPTEQWTVEQVLQWWLLRANDESQAEYDRIVSDLNEQLQEGKQSLWQAHKEVSDILNNDTHVGGSVGGGGGVENSNPQQSTSQPVDATTDSKPAASHTTNTTTKTTTTAAAAAAAAASSSLSQNQAAPIDTIHLDVLAGEYEGTTFDLQPKGRTPAFVGRSQGKKFKERGVSLPKDLEVSTTHGKFECLKGTFYYTDTGSTNGSLIDGCEIEAAKAYELCDHMRITCGQTILQVTLMSSSSKTSS